MDPDTVLVENVESISAASYRPEAWDQEHMPDNNSSYSGTTIAPTPALIAPTPVLTIAPTPVLTIAPTPVLTIASGL